MAVGGVTPQNAIDYFSHGYCGVGIGSALVNKKDLKEKNWDKITEDVKQFLPEAMWTIERRKKFPEGRTERRKNICTVARWGYCHC